MSSLQKWQVLNSQMLINHPFCQVRRDEVELSNGKVIDDYFVNIKPDVALVLPITHDQKVVFVRQYRHAVGDFFIELPAGRFYPGEESAEAAALRELREETGYVAENLRKIGTLHDNPSKETNQTHLFLAENVVKVGEQQNLDLTEEIEVILMPINAIFEKITTGEISVAGTVAALFLGLKIKPDSYIN
ncbi:NUDIX hydrolase [Anabaena sp. UHCC 0451]|uniref:NUDIX hydrolase n=1 Tax=Anabaena sp. UHCC 0451 TaxID=2055235 RepID=UPI002B21B266|nr:NUDIX hydrolase [Anabaena sp. UHCC 0451]MEA5579699.1 NUDIX hydrolase [Anabaena sp. UHCC 0451]